MKVHLRAAGDMGKKQSNRTFCFMPLRSPRRKRIMVYPVVEDPKLVTCGKCLARMRRLKRYG